MQMAHRGAQNLTNQKKIGSILKYVFPQNWEKCCCKDAWFLLYILQPMLHPITWELILGFTAIFTNILLVN